MTAKECRDVAHAVAALRGVLEDPGRKKLGLNVVDACQNSLKPLEERLLETYRKTRDKLDDLTDSYRESLGECYDQLMLQLDTEEADEADESDDTAPTAQDAARLAAEFNRNADAELLPNTSSNVHDIRSGSPSSSSPVLDGLSPPSPSLELDIAILRTLAASPYKPKALTKEVAAITGQAPGDIALRIADLEQRGEIVIEGGSYVLPVESQLELGLAAGQ